MQKSRRRCRRPVELWPRTRPHLLFELTLDDLLLLVRFLLVGPENQLGVGRQRLQENVESFAVLVFEGDAKIQSVVFLSLALDDGIGAMCRARHGHLHDSVATGPRT
jgi:hypothetical protein